MYRSVIIRPSVWIEFTNDPYFCLATYCHTRICLASDLRVVVPKQDRACYGQICDDRAVLTDTGSEQTGKTMVLEQPPVHAPITIGITDLLLNR